MDLITNDHIHGGFGYRRAVIVELAEVQYLKMLMPALKRLLTKEERNLEYFDGLHEIGEETEEQQNERMRLSEKVEDMRDIMRFINTVKISR
jgi:hypothetical protein